MIRYGKTARGSQRWQCKFCSNTHTSRNRPNHFFRQYIWFKKWIVEGLTVKQLAGQSGHSKWEIRSTIHFWLAQSVATPDTKQSLNCLFDGTYLDRACGILALMATDVGIVKGTYGATEKPRDLVTFFRSLNEQGTRPKSMTVDGNINVIRALRAEWPDVIIQRCLVHIQRQGLMWCRHVPKRLDARKLRELFLGVTAITSHVERNTWLTQLASWEARYGCRIAASRETGWVFSDLKRARSMLLKAIPNMFHYLDHPDIPRTTNGLEGYFGRLKDRYRDHRGLARMNRESYFKWYFYLCPR